MEERSTAFSGEQYANPYPPGIEAHYWNQARNRIVLRKLRGVLGPGTKALDLGCGPGIVVDYLRKQGVDCQGADLGTPLPATPAVAPYLHLGASAFELPPSFRESITLILLMDVLEHLPAPAEFLENCARHFPNARHVFLTLPARMEIWSSYDEYYGHFRRYSLETLSEVYASTGFSLVTKGYFFHSLYVAARLLALRSNQRSVTVATPKVRWPHALLGRVFALEEELTPPTVPGSSLFALLERRS